MSQIIQNRNPGNMIIDGSTVSSPIDLVRRWNHIVRFVTAGNSDRVKTLLNTTSFLHVEPCLLINIGWHPTFTSWSLWCIKLPTLWVITLRDTKLITASLSSFIQAIFCSNYTLQEYHSDTEVIQWWTQQDTFGNAKRQLNFNYS